MDGKVYGKNEVTPHAVGDNEDPEPLTQKETRSTWLSRRSRLVLSTLLLALVILGLALGLGLGLGLRHHGGTPAPSATPSPEPGPIWQPRVNMSWQIILDYPLRIDDENPTIEPDVDVYDIDMFLSQNNTVIANLHKLGKKVICYFSAGSYEPWRPDAYKFLDSDLGNTLAGWANERWLNISSPSVRAIMASRIEMASKIGCDAIDPDNVDGYQNDSGLDLTATSSIQFLNFLAGLAREHNLAIGLKNSLDIIKDVLHLVQFSVNEECANYHECFAFSDFIQDNKPVFHVEYPAGAPGAISTKEQQDSCEASGAAGFSTVLKTLELTSWVEYCNGQTANTSVITTTVDDHPILPNIF